MRPREEELIDPEITEQLDAIDATLAGEPVAPRFAELAELALMLSSCRPDGPRPEFARELDRRVEGRFRTGGAGALSGGGGGSGSSSRRGARWWGRWGGGPMLGAGATAFAAVLIAVAVYTSGGGSSTSTTAYSGNGVTKTPATTTATTNGPSRSINGPLLKGFSGKFSGAGPATPAAPGAASSSATTAPAQAPAAAAQSTVGIPSPAPLPNGRRIVQSSTLELGTPARRIDAVAQEVFNEVRFVNGIVQTSNVSSTGGPGASAQFQLRIPSQFLTDALTALSKLRYANVISRTDSTQDVNSPYLSLQRQIATAKAVLVRLRAKLAATTDPTQIASLRQQIAGENAILARAEASLHGLSRQITYSNVYVTLQATTGGGGVTPVGGGGFGLHQAGHDALRVLEVTAGIALIVLAALVPVGLLVALAWWIAATLQRRRRERALDLA
jgi:hypothetical protein